MKQFPTVSVAIITHNHGAYIDEAIQSILHQDILADIEVVIGDDASTDDTLNKLKAWANRYPDNIRLIMRDKNVGMMENFLGVIEACRGKYIAFLEGDDYWIDSTKLSAQVQLMEINPDWSMVFGSIEIFDHATKKVLGKQTSGHDVTVYCLADLVVRNPCNLMTAFFKKPQWISRPPVFTDAPFGDWPLFVFLAESGKVVYQPLVWARYRVHDRGVWQNGTAGRIESREVQMLQKFYGIYNAYRRHIGKALRGKQWKICIRALKVGDFRAAFFGLKQAYFQLNIIDKIYWIPVLFKFYWLVITDKRFYFVLINRIKLI